MLDFLLVATRINKGVVEVYPKFKIINSDDLMIRGGDFYAIWDERRGFWSTDEQIAIRLIDLELDAYANENKDKFESKVRIMHMWDADSGSIDKWHKYCQKQMRDNYHSLDDKLVFANDMPKKEDYASKILPYPLEQCPTPAYDELMSVLYSPDERMKIEWAIGSVISGESKKLQKFVVLYGAAGTGKSTVLNIIQQLTEGYYAVFDAKALGSSNNSFALEAFKSNPLVAIQHDGDLSRIEDNTRLNSLVSHELMTVNEKFKAQYSNRFKSFLFMGTNKPVKITDGKSGLIRRLIDVSPTGNKVSASSYKKLTKQIAFELGGIAWKCKELYLSDPGKYDSYLPKTMLGASNDFYNFVSDAFFVFESQDKVTLKAAWEMYKTYCDEANVSYPMPQRAFKEELKNYFWDFQERTSSGERMRNVYSGFRKEKFTDGLTKEVVNEESTRTIQFNKRKSIFDTECADLVAQYANDNGTPIKKWSEVTTHLSDLDTSLLHYVKLPKNHIVIDFDIPDENGEKSYERNLEEASKWPPTYAELSKSKAGIHLHYIYEGDVSKLARLYDDHIEIKVFTGNSSLRRQLSKCNDLPIAVINSGLPLKEEKEVVNFERVQSEKSLRTLIKKNLKKEIHPGTKPSIDFIFKILEDAYNSGMKYDVSDLRGAIFTFASGSTHQADYCVKLVSRMKFKSKEEFEPEPDESKEQFLVFYDVEVFPNLFLVNYKAEGGDKAVVRMINPSPEDIERLLKFNLVGFNNKRYDNHILYGRLLGYNNKELYNLSQRIVAGDRNAFFKEAYNVSYTDILDFSSKKQSLKKWEIELGIKHQELGLPWDQPVPEELWGKVAEYCDNDVLATEALFNHLKGDWTARRILANLADMTVNASTNSLTTRIIFGNERNPELVYTHLEETFPGYFFGTWSDYYEQYPEYLFEPQTIEEERLLNDRLNDNHNHNLYRGTDLGFGGYIISNPGIYYDADLDDVVSLHPNSIRAMGTFGKYTKNFTDLVDGRVAIKNKEFDVARKLMNGKLAPYLDDESTANDLAQALKIAINSVYGLTAASFDNPFRDPRNVNNIVALRGALFMRTLQDEVESRGFKIVAIKTDSIKIANATKEINEFCSKFAKKYGYTFDHEASYDRICQINDADYIAKYADPEECMSKFGYIPKDNAKHPNQWTATGKQFQVPYVFKTLFSKEDIVFEDLCETKEVKTALYLDCSGAEEPTEETVRFIGKVGNFCPMKEGTGGGRLYREKDGKYYAATGTKGYFWQESAVVKDLDKEDCIDKSYYEDLVSKAVVEINKYGDYEAFANGD